MSEPLFTRCDLDRRKLLRLAAVVSPVALISGCTSADRAALKLSAEKFVIQLNADIPKIQKLYGIAKGMALAVAADMPLSPTAVAIAAAIAIADPLLAEIEDGIATAAKLATIAEQTNELTLAAAPHMTVMANAA